MRKVRYTRDGSGWRVFTGGNLIGWISEERVVVVVRTGRKANRWFYTIAATAWGLDTRAPDDVPVRARIGPLSPQHGNRNAAGRALVEHLRRAHCPTVDHLYRSTP